MTNARNFIACVSLGALLPMAAIAAMSDAEATLAVQDALANEQSADSIITMLTDDGRDLDDATELAMAAAPDADKSAIAKAGICAAEDATEAEAVAAGLLPAAGAELAAIINALVENYNTGGCDGEENTIKPPPSYAPSDTSNSGGSNPDFPGSPSS